MKRSIFMNEVQKEVGSLDFLNQCTVISSLQKNAPALPNRVSLVLLEGRLEKGVYSR